MSTFVFIVALARMGDSPCWKHGDVVECIRLLGYVTTRAWQVTFEDGTARRYGIRAGRPVPLEA